MKVRSILLSSACLFLAGTLSINATTWAQQDSETQGRQRSGRFGRLDDTTEGANIRASELIGMNIQNPKGEDVGEVNDLVINGNTGRIRYAAVTYGGFFGVGDKWFAVPFQAFTVKPVEGDPDEYVLTLDVTQKQLEGQQGFDEDHWPNFADREFTNRIDERYGVERRRLRNRNRRDLDVDVNRRGVNVDIDDEN